MRTMTHAAAANTLALAPIDPRPAAPTPADLLPLLLGLAITLAVRGYEFGNGNHAIYLIAPLRQAFPGLLDHDWWATHTLQYHVAYTAVVAWLMRLGCERPALLFAQLALMAALHWQWWRLARALGLGTRAYLLSVALYYLNAGGIAPGAYRFDQEASVFPATIANVALLWALVAFVEARWLTSATALGLAGLFHLNHAAVAWAFWGTVGLIELRKVKPREGETREGEAPSEPRFTAARDTGAPRLTPTRWLTCLTIILLPALPNVLNALATIARRDARMPLPEFVDLYVRLRHPHHYDPLSWPAALWVSFLWPIAVMIAWRVLSVARRTPAARTEPRPPTSDARRRAWAAATFFLCLLALAFCFAGLTFVSEPLIQLSLFRFSIYPKLLSCLGVAGLVLATRGRFGDWLRSVVRRGPALLVVGLATTTTGAFGAAARRFVTDNGVEIAVVVVLISAAAIRAGWPPMWLRGRLPKWAVAAAVLLVLLTCASLVAHAGRLRGLQLAVDDQSTPAYLDVCRWARTSTPTDAIFLVPPAEQAMRFHGQRAIVVNFKGVPQLSGELAEWRDRLQTLLARPITDLPHRFDLAHAALAAGYDGLPAAHLEAVARHYDARYIVLRASSAAAKSPPWRLAYRNADYLVYDRAPD